MSRPSPGREGKTEVKLQAWAPFDLVEVLDQAVRGLYCGSRKALILRYIVEGLRRDGYLPPPK